MLLLLLSGIEVHWPADAEHPKVKAFIASQVTLLRQIGQTPAPRLSHASMHREWKHACVHGRRALLTEYARVTGSRSSTPSSRAKPTAPAEGAVRVDRVVCRGRHAWKASRADGGLCVANAARCACPAQVRVPLVEAMFYALLLAVSLLSWLACTLGALLFSRRPRPQAHERRH